MDIFWLIIIILIAIFSLWLLKLLFSVVIKLLIAAIIVLILFAVFVHGAETRIFEGYVFSDQSITVDDKPFTITFDPQPDTIMLKYNRNYYFVPADDCKTIMNLKFCYDSYTYDIDKNKYKVDLIVYSVSPDIKITRTIDKKDLLVGEEAEISVNVTNGVGLAAENFTFIDSFPPDEFEITDVSWCSEENNSAFYSGYIKENDFLKCSYKIKPLKKLQRSSRAKVSYFDGTEMKDLYSSTIQFDVSPFFEINTEFNVTDKKVFLGEEVLLIINMTNKNEDEDTNLSSLDIYLPSGLTYLSTATIKKEGTNLTLRSQQVEKNGNIIHYEDKFNRDQSKFIILKLKAIKAGSSNIFIFSKYSAGELGEEEEQKETLEVENQEISIQTSFKDDEKFDSGEETYIKINVINPSEEVTLKNIAVGVKTPIYNFSPAFIKYLNTLSNQPAINQKIAMPTVSSNKDFKFDVTIDYETEFGERFEKTFEYTITVDAIEGLVVTHELSEASVEEGGEITVKTKVENKRNVDIKDVQVFDVIHMDLGRKGLSSVSNININALDTVTAYEYTILAPEEVKADTKYKIRATAKYTEDNKTYAFEKEDEITVTKKKLDLSISRAVSDPTPYMGTILDVLYTISNPEDEELRDIVVRFPVQEDVELVGDKNFTIGKLDPGESYTMKNVHKIRAKQNGTLTIKPATFIYEDKNGNIFVKNSSEISFSPKFGYIAGPAYNISQKSPEQVKAGDNIKITLNVKNIGTEQGKINVIDGGNSWIFNLEPGEQETASYSYQALKTGEFKVKPLKGEYYYLGKKIYTISNELSVNVYEEGPPEEIQEEEVTPQEEISVEGVTERKTFFGIVWDTIKQVFSLIRR